MPDHVIVAPNDACVQTCGGLDRRKAVLARAGALFDDDDLAIAVVATVRANVMGPMKLAARLAGHQLRALEEDMAPAVALTVPANSLFRKRAHCFSPCIATFVAEC
jgi:hypothetical protein